MISDTRPRIAGFVLRYEAVFVWVFRRPSLTCDTGVGEVDVPAVFSSIATFALNARPFFLLLGSSHIALVHPSCLGDIQLAQPVARSAKACADLGKEVTVPLLHPYSRFAIGAEGVGGVVHYGSEVVGETLRGDVGDGDLVEVFLGTLGDVPLDHLNVPVSILTRLFMPVADSMPEFMNDGVEYITTWSH